MIDWWTEADQAILDCLRVGGPMSLEDLSCRTGLSRGEVTSFVSMLVREGRIRIGMVELTQGESERHTGPRSREAAIRRLPGG